MMECYLAIRRNEVLIYVTAWMNLENVMLSERQLAYDITYRCNLNWMHMNKFTKQKHTHKLKKQRWLPGEKGRGAGIVRELEFTCIHYYTGNG